MIRTHLLTGPLPASSPALHLPAATARPAVAGARLLAVIARPAMARLRLLDCGAVRE
ncbi:hypothetical protein [Actinoplanes cyaneus]|uniref:hypothetical protein n=1 Tax=Actinoplanes cyaneus TaxID=52696 RepID=UPI0019426E0C|nr:hypothetical protein [Actinoplanes cyaneus]MCW2142634.1 hypothetical protein [Actinoplanes cyaneus]